MENKKDIGKAFRERLDLLEKAPDADLWGKIENDLHKKRKKRYFGWLFIASSFIIIALFLWNNYSAETRIENQNSQNQLDYSNKNISSLEDSKGDSTNQTVHTTTELDTTKQTRKTVSKSISSKKKNELQTSAENQKKSNKTVRLITSNSQYDEYEVVEKYRVRVNHKGALYKGALPKQRNNLSKKGKRSAHLLIASRKKQSRYHNKNKRTQNTKTNLIKNQSKTELTNSEASKVQIATEQIKPFNPKSDSLENAIASPEFKKDSLVKKKPKTKVPASKKKNEKDTKKDSLKFEYYIAGYYGPTISGSLLGKSLLNDSFNKDSKKHPITSSYGIYFGTKRGKVGVRVGLSKIDLENRIQIANYPNGPISDYSNIELHSNVTPASISTHLSTSNEVILTQNVSYLTIPLEFSYTFFNKGKFDFDGLVGINVTVLDKNNIRISGNQAPELSIGRTESLAETNFAFNLGAGANYNLTPKLQANITSMLKYFYNIGNEHFKPYSISLQTGITYKF